MRAVKRRGSKRSPDLQMIRPGLVHGARAIILVLYVLIPNYANA